MSGIGSKWPKMATIGKRVKIAKCQKKQSNKTLKAGEARREPCIEERGERKEPYNKAQGAS